MEDWAAAVAAAALVVVAAVAATALIVVSVDVGAAGGCPGCPFVRAMS